MAFVWTEQTQSWNEDTAISEQSLLRNQRRTIQEQQHWIEGDPYSLELPCLHSRIRIWTVRQCKKRLALTVESQSFRPEPIKGCLRICWRPESDHGEQSWRQQRKRDEFAFVAFRREAVYDRFCAGRLPSMLKAHLHSRPALWSGINASCYTAQRE